MSIIGGRVVKTPSQNKPYKVVLEHDGATPDTEHPVDSIREGETLIREKSPSPPGPELMREWNSEN